MTRSYSSGVSLVVSAPCCSLVSLPCSPTLGEMERGEFGACTFVELSGAEHPKAVQHMRVEHVALTARSDVLVTIGWLQMVLCTLTKPKLWRRWRRNSQRASGCRSLEECWKNHCFWRSWLYRHLFQVLLERTFSTLHAPPREYVVARGARALHCVVF